MADPLDCSLDLLRRLPPSNITQNVAKLLQLRPELSEELLSSVDQPLQVATCKKTGLEFLLCDYNRDGSCFRSPHSGEYQSDDGSTSTSGYKPSAQLSQLEKAFNDAFATYRDLYFGGGVSSVYLWDLDEGFAGAVLIKKVNSENGQNAGSWDSTHVIQVTTSANKKSAVYQLTSTIMLQILSPSTTSVPSIDLGGSLTRQTEQELPIDTFHSHLANVGRMVEEMEIKMRGTIQEIYFGKTKDILNDLRSLTDLKTVRGQNAMQAQLMGRLKERQGH
ncbi:hypothetical protein HDU91_005801 [Kappamyces sp. JEL0680]|nr:hypothetical protein HDU91_005801 [Kappamyces sp. JEL0680]